MTPPTVARSLPAVRSPVAKLRLKTCGLTLPPMPAAARPNREALGTRARAHGLADPHDPGPVHRIEDGTGGVSPDGQPCP